MTSKTADSAAAKRRRVSWYHRRIANPLMRRLVGHMPGQALLETTGRRSGLPRRTPVGGRVVGGSFWMVSNHGLAAAYVRNIAADPRVRVQIRSRWHTGTAHLLPDDDARARLRELPRFNSWNVRMLGTDLMTIRIDLE
ncbi:nitroreductase family deazaflavin-dependent oxidoreductase [Nocardia sp. NEAU-G5]|uniref:Nitroreductase family deazaflavin-dependent oxidoreductase n=1 Tax=Nocardia albiluteola TaxID=2842303 RepID=A0ABS6AUD7_9NOCA|nr:nitroreductase/quinone reductase family protein [Nocardia albiluteola]MBU3060866.1 nitroreductase family deazaflavin-dependent oxidoreductase [Nocardia albiluteola]